MPQLKVPPADAALKAFAGQFIVTVHNCHIIVSRAPERGFTRNRGLVADPIVSIGARDYVAGIAPNAPAVFLRQRADVLAARSTFTEAVEAAYTFFEADEPSEVAA